MYLVLFKLFEFFHQVLHRAVERFEFRFKYYIWAAKRFPKPTPARSHALSCIVPVYLQDCVVHRWILRQRENMKGNRLYLNLDHVLFTMELVDQSHQCVPITSKVIKAEQRIMNGNVRTMHSWEFIYWSKFDEWTKSLAKLASLCISKLKFIKPLLEIRNLNKNIQIFTVCVSDTSIHYQVFSCIPKTICLSNELLSLFANPENEKSSHASEQINSTPRPAGASPVFNTNQSQLLIDLLHIWPL